MAESKFRDVDGWLKPNIVIYIPLRKKFYRLTTIEGMQYQTGKASTAEFSSVASAAVSGDKNISVLEPDDNPDKLFQIRPSVKDGCNYFWKLKTGTNRYGTDTDKDVGFMTNELSPIFGSNRAFEFFLVNDWYPAVNASNVTGSATTPRVYFVGRKYNIVELSSSEADSYSDDPDSYFVVTLGGVNE